jgi:poly(3-hydroxybutyrate) depolymerase
MYAAYEVQRALLRPVNGWARLVRKVWSHPRFPPSRTVVGRAIAASSELLERTTRRYPKVPFAIATTEIDGRPVAVREEVVLRTPFCNLLRFARDGGRDDPKVLLVTPLSGHHATLLRETVQLLLPDHDVYVTDWIDARLVPPSKGRFDLDDYVALVQDFLRHLGLGVHVVSVCQPCVAVLAAVALMEESEERAAPRSLTLVAGPVDTRVNPTAVNLYVRFQPLAWFAWTAVHRVPLGRPGAGRRVYPGFLQLAGFVYTGALRHAAAHWKIFFHALRGDDARADAHRRFYDDYFAVMDVPAEYYLQTLRTVFKTHDLARGTMTWRGRRVRLEAIRRTALMTVEGGADDVITPGQTAAAHALCPAIPPERRRRLVVPGVGHFGVFSGRGWRKEIAPRLREFIAASEERPPLRAVPRPSAA